MNGDVCELICFSLNCGGFEAGLIEAARAVSGGCPPWGALDVASVGPGGEHLGVGAVVVADAGIELGRGDHAEGGFDFECAETNDVAMSMERLCSTSDSTE